MRTARLSHDRDGFRLHISDIPLWAQLVEELTDRVCAALRHPRACRLVDVGFRAAERHERQLLEISLEVTQAVVLEPDFVVRCVD